MEHFIHHVACGCQYLVLGSSIENPSSLFRFTDHKHRLISPTVVTSIECPQERQVTVICHFRNEERMLPFWLAHHTRLFDHGIMIDYASTDKSREIIQQWAPDWSVYPTRNKLFSTHEIDREIMDTESTVKGWKMALNATEFLITSDLRGYINGLMAEDSSTMGIRTHGFVMVDPVELVGSDPLPGRPLWESRHLGYSEPDPMNANAVCRSRLLHRDQHGRYGPGRHETGVQCRRSIPLFLLWYGWSPLHWKMDRNESTRPMLDPKDLEKGWGTHHTLSSSSILTSWRQGYLKHSSDLLLIPELAGAIKDASSLYK